MTTDTVPAPQNAQAFFEAVEHRRSYYNITKEAILSDDDIRALVERSVKHTPTSFNMQQSRAVVLTGAAHERLWDVVTEAWNKGVEEEEKRNGFKGQVDHAFRPGYGSILFFEDQAVLDEFSGKMPAYSASFNGPWSENSAGILQYVVWTALEAEGYGASLQHFGGISPAVHQAVIDAFKLPASWKRSTAIMPFGKPSGGPGKPGSTKQFKPLEDRVLVFTE